MSFSKHLSRWQRLFVFACFILTETFCVSDSAFARENPYELNQKTNLNEWLNKINELHGDERREIILQNLNLFFKRINSIPAPIDQRRAYYFRTLAQSFLELESEITRGAILEELDAKYLIDPPKNSFSHFMFDSEALVSLRYLVYVFGREWKGYGY
ncbi:MAG: hypothetical protein JWQ35_1869 [Bacteriovoracaceae bacterium]|nr:hypothetical protein [Bacteriovoracaceae bacterium]